MRSWLLGVGLNWRSAATELGLITAGVLIALGMDSCWSDRNDRQRETAYLRQLLEDVRVTEEGLHLAIADDSTYLARATLFLEAANRFHRTAGREGALPADSLRKLAAPSYSLFVPLTGTYTALVQGGDMHLLRNQSIRLNVIGFAATIASAQDMLRATEAQVWRNSEQMSLALWRMIPPPGTPWSGVEPEALLRDAHILNTVEMQRIVGMNRLWALRSLKEPIATLRRLLESELKAR